MGAPLRAAVAAIERVHGDGTLPTIVVRRLPWPPGNEGRYDPRPPYSIVVGEGAFHPRLTLLHEVGHLLDHHGLGQSTEFASASDPSLADWRAVTQASRLVAELQQINRTATDPGLIALIRYLMQPTELWARSYAQFVALRSGDAEIAAQLDARRQPPVGGTYTPRQWADADFDPIADAIDSLFWRMGWLV